MDGERADAILQFDPTYRVETIKPKAFRPPKDWSNRGPDEPDRAQHPPTSRRAAYQPRDIALELLVEREAIALPLDHAFGFELADVRAAAIEVQR